MHALSTWWQLLSFSRSAFWLLAVVLAGGGCIAALRLLRPEAPTPRRQTPWPITDYSRARQQKIDSLGERYLLARPINTPCGRPSTSACTPGTTPKICA